MLENHDTEIKSLRFFCNLFWLIELLFLYIVCTVEASNQTFKLATVRIAYLVLVGEEIWFRLGRDCRKGRVVPSYLVSYGA